MPTTDLIAEVERLLTAWKSDDDSLCAIDAATTLAETCGDRILAAIKQGKADRAEVERLKGELAAWKPLTPEEAERALDDAKAGPMSEADIARIMAKASIRCQLCGGNRVLYSPDNGQAMNCPRCK